MANYRHLRQAPVQPYINSREHPYITWLAAQLTPLTEAELQELESLTYRQTCGLDFGTKEEERFCLLEMRRG